MATADDTADVRQVVLVSYHTTFGKGPLHSTCYKIKERKKQVVNRVNQRREAFRMNRFHNYHRNGLPLNLRLVPHLLLLLLFLQGSPSYASCDLESSLKRFPANAIMNDILINAEIWSDQLEILSMDVGFADIVGNPFVDDSNDVSKEELRYYSGLVGAPFTDHICMLNGNSTEEIRSGIISNLVTSSVTGQTDIFYADAMPVVFSHPILFSTVIRDAFEITLNTGETVVPSAVMVIPNWDYNERNIVVMLYDGLSNKKRWDEEGAIYPVSMEIVADVMFVDEFGDLINGRGLQGAAKYSFLERGPEIIKAKIYNATDVFSDSDEETADVLDLIADANPFGIANNDLLDLYPNAQFAITVLSNWGMTKDGLTAFTPSDYNRLFQVSVELNNGTTVVLAQSGIEYDVDNYTIEVIGLAELGVRQDSYDECYGEDRDNFYIIALNGDIEAMEKIKSVILPASGTNPETGEDYYSVYSPGGPGLYPNSTIIYAAKAERSEVEVMNELFSRKIVSYNSENHESLHEELFQYLNITMSYDNLKESSIEALGPTILCRLLLIDFSFEFSTPFVQNESECDIAYVGETEAGEDVYNIDLRLRLFSTCQYEIINAVLDDVSISSMKLPVLNSFLLENRTDAFINSEQNVSIVLLMENETGFYRPAPTFSPALPPISIGTMVGFESIMTTSITFLPMILIFVFA